MSTHTQTAEPGPTPRRRILLMGCGKDKREGTHPARELYTGQLFTARRRYVEALGQTWYIVSAKYRLLEPTERVASYDMNIDRLSARARKEWGHRVLLDICEKEPAPIVLELHAGELYARPIIAAAAELGIPTEWPVEGLGIGTQRHFYANPNHKTL